MRLDHLLELAIMRGGVAKTRPRPVAYARVLLTDTRQPPYGTGTLFDRQVEDQAAFAALLDAARAVEYPGVADHQYAGVVAPMPVVNDHFVLRAIIVFTDGSWCEYLRDAGRYPEYAASEHWVRRVCPTRDELRLLASNWQHVDLERPGLADPTF